ncbi:plasmid mobilization relaxosome protein MobC [Shimia sp. R9_2]|nr:plasmid mobilization relaxosome protein MobC [Shimia sp. R9_2]
MPLSSYIKSVVLEGSAPSYRKRRRTPDQNDKLLGQILTRLGASRVPNNLNQIAKHLNQGTLVIDEALEQDLREAVEVVAFVRATLTQALGVDR